MGLRRPEAVIEGREELGAELRGDDSASSPVGRIGAALDHLAKVFGKLGIESRNQLDRALSETQPAQPV